MVENNGGVFEKNIGINNTFFCLSKQFEDVILCSDNKRNVKIADILIPELGVAISFDDENSDADLCIKNNFKLKNLGYSSIRLRHKNLNQLNGSSIDIIVRNGEEEMNKALISLFALLKRNYCKYLDMSKQIEEKQIFFKIHSYVDLSKKKASIV